MGSIQSSVGLVSGLNIEDTVNKLMQVAARPRDLLVSRVKNFQNQQAALNDILATTIGVQLSTDRLGSVDSFNSVTATSSNKDVLSATASSTASPGTYSFNAVQTAQSSAATSGVFTSASQTLTAGNLVVRAGGFVDGSANLDNLRGGEGVARGIIEITDRSGISKKVDLRFAVSAEDVIKKINSTDGIKVAASLDGDRIVLKDLTGQTASNLIVSEVGQGRTAADLGLGSVNVSSSTATGQDLAYLGNATNLSSLLDGRGVRFGSGEDLKVNLHDGTSVSIDLNSTKDGDPASIGQLLDRINAAGTNKFQARISSSGKSIELIDLTSGSSAFSVTSPNGKVADDLGLNQSTSGSTLTGVRLQSGLSGPLLSSLKGGEGPGTLGTISVTNRNGVTKSIDLSGSTTLRDVLTKINDANAGVVATLNKNRTGIVLQDTTGATSSNLKIANGDGTNSATHLQIEADVSTSSIDSGSLGLQFVGENTSLNKLNQGNGVSLGSFVVTDSAGKSTTVNLAASLPKTLGDVLKTLNNLNIGVKATLNKTGDGFQLIDTAGGTGELSVVDSGSGKAAADLGIAGKGTSQTIDGQSKIAISSSQNLTLAVTAGQKLSDLITTINAKSGPVKASLLNSGGGGVRLLLNSSSTGEIGRIALESDSTGLTFNITSQARDAVLSVGSSEESGGTLITSSTNTFTNAISGVQLTINSASSTPVSINVSSSASSVQKNVQSFVDQVNKLLEKVRSVSDYDPDTKTTGVLFGSTETLRVESTLTRFVNSSTPGKNGIKSLAQLGVTFDKDGKLNFDTTKFQKQLADNPQAVQDFFTTKNTGFSARAKKIIDTLSGVKNSVLVSRTQALQSQIDTTNKRVDFFNARLDVQKTRLQTQFFAMEATLSKLQLSQKSIANIGKLTA